MPRTSGSTGAADPMSVAAIEKETTRRVTVRIVPFLMVCYFVAFVDRVNAGFAALQMNKDLGLSATQFGLGAGLFYLTYVLLEIPSNLALQKVGARLWIARIMITWGLVSGATAFVAGPYSFYAVRLLLGAAEAGFFPGVILYLTYWFPAEYRGRIVALFMVAVPISSFLGSPISAAILQADNSLGVRGWQWLFILEALPAILLGVATWFVLPDGPSRAKWLSSEQREWLTHRLAFEQSSRTHAVGHLPLKRLLSNKYVLAAALVYAGASGASQCLSLWQPQILKSFGHSITQTGLLNAIPFGLASIIMIWWGHHSDKNREHVWHTAIPLALIATSLAAGLLINSLAGTMIVLALAVIGTYAFKGPFWALSTEWLSAGAAAAGIAQINAIGNIGGFVGTYLLGVIKDATGSYPIALLPLAALSAAGTGAVMILGRGQRRGTQQPNP